MNTNDDDLLLGSQSRLFLRLLSSRYLLSEVSKKVIELYVCVCVCEREREHRVCVCVCAICVRFF